jgi:hypothetical protein
MSLTFTAAIAVLFAVAFLVGGLALVYCRGGLD